MVGVSLANDLKDRGVSVGIFHPGWVRTDMTNYNGHLTAEESSRLLIQRIKQLDLTSTGQFLHASGDHLQW